MTFQKCDGAKINNLKEYILDYLQQYPDVKIYIGTDSKRRKMKYVYISTLCFRHPSKGVHIIYQRNVFNMKSISSMFEKLWKEVVLSIDVLTYLLEFIDTDRIILDLDYNVVKECKSNMVHDSAIGWVTALGIKVRAKPNAWAATTAADFLCNKGTINN
jgi:uncharacterized protein